MVEDSFAVVGGVKKKRVRLSRTWLSGHIS
jgi:hypothetical protein